MSKRSFKEVLKIIFNTIRFRLIGLSKPFNEFIESYKTSAGWILVFVSFFLFIVILCWLLYELLFIFKLATTLENKLKALENIISTVGLVATLSAAIGVLLNYLNARRTSITDRLNQALERIDNKKEKIAIAGIYSLEKIAKDYPRYQWLIMEILSNFVKENSANTMVIPEQDFEKNEEVFCRLVPVNTTVQSALMVIGRRNTRQDLTQEDYLPKELRKKIDLSKICINWAVLHFTNFKGANLNRSCFYRSVLIGADFQDSDLRHAHLEKASLYHADLRGAHLENAHLEYAELKYADLRGAHLENAHLEHAELKCADLRGAHLENAHLEYAELKYADLRGAHLKNAYFTYAYLYRSKYNLKEISLALILEEWVLTEADWSEDKKKWIVKDQIANRKKIEEIRQNKTSDS